MPIGDCSVMIDTILAELEKDPVLLLSLSYR